MFYVGVDDRQCCLSLYASGLPMNKTADFHPPFHRISRSKRRVGLHRCPDYATQLLFAKPNEKFLRTYGRGFRNTLRLSYLRSSYVDTARNCFDSRE